jgi:hypothetical protein
MKAKEDSGGTSPPTTCEDEVAYPRLRDEDVQRIAQAVVDAMRRERFVDDVARSLKQKLDET